MTEPLTTETLLRLVCQYRRVGLTGAPMSGKSYAANAARLADPTLAVIHGDDYLREGWSGGSQAIADAAAQEGRPLIVEGVQVPRAMRKGMQLGCLVVLSPARPLTRGHEVMRKGLETVLAEVMRLPGHSRTPVMRFGPQY